MWITNLSLLIHSQSSGTMWVDHVPQPQLATCGPLIDSPTINYCSNDLEFATRLQSHMPNNDVCTMPFDFDLSFSNNSCKNSKLEFHFVKHLPKSLLASCKVHDGVMVYITLWPLNTIWTLPKSLIHYPQTTLVKPHSLTKASKIHN